MAIDARLLWLLCCLLTTEQVRGNSEVAESKPTVYIKPTTRFTLHCKSEDVPLITSCKWHDASGHHVYRLGRPNGVVVALDATNSTCMVQVPPSKESHNGEWQCDLRHETVKVSKIINVVVINRPKNPVITVNGKRDTLTIGENDRPNVTCEADEGRPPAHLNMYLSHHNFKKRVRAYISAWQNKNQDGTYASMVSWKIPKHKELVKFNGWTLTCEAQHEGYRTNPKESKIPLNVLYRPSFQYIKDEYHGVLGKALKIYIRFKANPKPMQSQIKLEVDMEDGGKVEMEAGRREFGNGTYTLGYIQEVIDQERTYDVLLIISPLQKEYTKYKHKIRVENSQSLVEHKFTITTDPYSPVEGALTGSKLSSGSIILVALIILAVAIVLAVVGRLLYCKLRRKDEAVMRNHSTKRKDYPTYSRYDSLGSPDEEGGFVEALEETHKHQMVSNVLKSGRQMFQPRTSRDKDEEVEKHYREALQTKDRNNIDDEFLAGAVVHGGEHGLTDMDMEQNREADNQNDDYGDQNEHGEKNDEYGEEGGDMDQDNGDAGGEEWS